MGLLFLSLAMRYEVMTLFLAVTLGLGELGWSSQGFSLFFGEWGSGIRLLGSLTPSFSDWMTW